MGEQNVVFLNKQLNLRMAGIICLPEPFDLSKDYIPFFNNNLYEKGELNYAL